MSDAFTVDRGRRARPRVLMFCTQFRPIVGGAERAAERLSKALIELGVHTEVLTIRYDRSWPAQETLASGLRIRRVPLPDVGRRLPRVRGIGAINTALLGRRIGREIKTRAGDFDVLHAHNASAADSAFAVRAARRLGITTVMKTVSTGRWFDLDMLGRQPVWGPIARRWLVRDTDGWIASSGAVAEDLRAAGIDTARVVLLPNGVDLPAASNRLPERARRFLHVGRLARTAPRDVMGLIEAFERVAAEHPDAELAIVGPGEQLGEIRDRVQGSPASGRIHVPGEADPEPWLKWAHCLVQPSFVEGMSNALLEGMASGLACVAYDIPPNREALAAGEAGVLVPMADRKALGEALALLASVDGLAAQWGLRARKRAAGFCDITAIAQRVAALYQRLLSERGQPRQAALDQFDVVNTK